MEMCLPCPLLIPLNSTSCTSTYAEASELLADTAPAVHESDTVWTAEFSLLPSECEISVLSGSGADGESTGDMRGCGAVNVCFASS